MNSYPSDIVEGVQALLRGAASLDEVAIATFRYQYDHNPAYARICARRGVTRVDGWRQVPHVHVDSFRHVTFFTSSPENATATFYTSGTTQDVRGTHHMLDVSLYRDASMMRFEQALLPPGRPRRLISLLGSPDELPNSSLARMLGWAIERFGAHESGYAVSGAELAALDEPILLLGTAFGLAQCLRDAPNLRLPPGTTIMETGGFKGRFTELTRSDLHAMYRRAGVDSTHVVGEYGMTELSSQWYDGVVGTASTDIDNRVYVAAPWARTRVLDAATLEDVSVGEVGLLCHFDPVNVGSVQMILTSDLGRRVRCSDGRDGFVYVGRASGAVVRGCSQLDEVM